MATDKYSYYTDEGNCYSAMELTVPGSDITSDIIAVFFDKEDGELTMVDYVYGATMMTDEEIWNFLIDTVLKHQRSITYVVRKEFWSYDGKDFVDAEDIHVFTNLDDAIALARELNRTEACCWEALPGAWETCSFCIWEMVNGEPSDIVMEDVQLGFVKSKNQE